MTALLLAVQEPVEVGLMERKEKYKSILIPLMRRGARIPVAEVGLTRREEKAGKVVLEEKAGKAETQGRFMILFTYLKEGMGMGLIYRMEYHSA
jgi:hypothetical protein